MHCIQNKAEDDVIIVKHKLGVYSQRHIEQIRQQTAKLNPVPALTPERPIEQIIRRSLKKEENPITKTKETGSPQEKANLNPLKKHRIPTQAS